VRAGLVRQERTGRISRCSLEAGPILPAAVWLNRYTKYWQQQFDFLVDVVKGLKPKSQPKRQPKPAAKPRSKGARP